MIVETVSIDGYGRFAGRSLTFTPGLQVIIGPNEQGKSTLRAFIGDMLYGQRKGASSLDFDDAKAMRLPWSSPDCYGGRLVYLLKDGRRIEVVRNFDPERESVQVLDAITGKDITLEFDLLRNREPNFAGAHLGLSKEVFLSAATISHFSLELLGDADALEQVRDKLVALADSGEDTSSAEDALALLHERMEHIGQPGMKTRPLARLRHRLQELEQEYNRVLERRLQAERLAGQRHGVLQEMTELRRRRLEIEEDLRCHETCERHDRVREAETLVARIGTATQHCFALGAVREFPAHKLPEVQQAEQKVNAARQQLERTLSERGTAARQLEEEHRVVGSDARREFGDLPDTLEERLNEAASLVQKAVEREREVAEFVAAGEQRLRNAQQLLGELPDFSRVAADPMDYVTQLANSFEISRRERNTEKRELEVIMGDIRKRQAAIADAHALFKDHHHFPELAREHELSKRMVEEKLSQRRSALLSAQGELAEISDQNPQFKWIFSGCLAAVLVLAALYLWTQLVSLLIAVLPLLAMVAYTGGMFRLNTRRQGRLEQEIEAARQEIQTLEMEPDPEPNPVEVLLERSGLETVRELEALYDKYREASLDLTARIAVLREQEAKTQEAEERIPQLLERLRETFEKIGETLAREEDVPEAAGRAITKYQQYREAKRQLTESRGLLERHQLDLRRAVTAREQAEQQMRAAEEELRGFLRAQGYEEERKHDSALTALRAYRTRVSRTREHRGRVEVLEERLHILERRMKEEELELEKLEQELGRLLAHAGVSSVTQFMSMADQAREYQEIWTKRALLEEQLHTLLQGRSLEELKAQLEASPVAPSRPRRPQEQLRTELESLTQTLDERTREEHELHVAIAEAVGAKPSLVETEEELAWVRRRVKALELEHEATSQAMALIEEAARDKHARIAPRLSQRASEYLSHITGGAYTLLRIGREFQIGVSTGSGTEVSQPAERGLSKGTVDQIYLALRLALVQSLSETGEPVPMLLDDPFANYDDSRLENTLRLLHGMPANQMLLFTCREDVARAAEPLGVPIIRL